MFDTSNFGIKLELMKSWLSFDVILLLSMKKWWFWLVRRNTMVALKIPGKMYQSSAVNGFDA